MCICYCIFFFFKQKTAYEVRISDWSSDVCSADLVDAAVDRDRVVVEEDDQLAETQVAGQRDRLVADAFHEAAVADDAIGVVIDQIVAEAGVQQTLGERHADGVGEALAERAGGGLDAGGVAVFRVPGRAAAELAEDRKSTRL